MVATGTLIVKGGDGDSGGYDVFFRFQSQGKLIESFCRLCLAVVSPFYIFSLETNTTFTFTFIFKESLLLVCSFLKILFIICLFLFSASFPLQHFCSHFPPFSFFLSWFLPFSTFSTFPPFCSFFWFIFEKKNLMFSLSLYIADLFSFALLFIVIYFFWKVFNYPRFFFVFYTLSRFYFKASFLKFFFLFPISQFRIRFHQYSQYLRFSFSHIPQRVFILSFISFFISSLQFNFLYFPRFFFLFVFFLFHIVVSFLLSFLW